RRGAFLVWPASLAVTAGITGGRAAMGPNDKFDLLIKGGDVLDPSQSLRGRRDIGIRFGVIEAFEPDIAEARALRVINASGKLVTPGLSRSTQPCLSLRVSHRPSCRRIRGQSMRHDMCFGG